MKLPHGKELLSFLPLAELYTEYQFHERLQVFVEKGRECVACGRVGTLLALGRETGDAKYTRKRKSHGRVHIDLYTDDFVLMTVDHIIPKKVCKELGWSDEMIESLDNKQPMCDSCNNGKGHKLVSDEELEKRRAQMKKLTNRRVYGSEITRSLVPNIHALLGDAI